MSVCFCSCCLLYVYVLCFSTGMSTEVMPTFKGAEFVEVLFI
jgi:hypothetical protein